VLFFPAAPQVAGVIRVVLVVDFFFGGFTDLNGLQFARVILRIQFPAIALVGIVFRRAISFQLDGVQRIVRKRVGFFIADRQRLRLLRTFFGRRPVRLGSDSPLRRFILILAQ
ncbi:MAG: hypothetical protein QF483_02455, partial [Gammaproteobacteria bacterium]|jgi:hypothetical protein|nr:hypothetical protein [Gammaproteobacteria bacterium]